jgi:dihydrofolate reductase
MDDSSQAMNDYARAWRGTKKIVYSTSLSELAMENAVIERRFDPDTVRTMVAASDRDFGIGGPKLAAQAIRADIVDEYHQMIVPELVGSGNYWLPTDIRKTLKLVNLRRFENGFVHLQYGRA